MPITLILACGTIVLDTDVIPVCSAIPVGSEVAWYVFFVLLGIVVRGTGLPAARMAYAPVREATLAVSDVTVAVSVALFWTTGIEIV